MYGYDKGIQARLEKASPDARNPPVFDQIFGKIRFFGEIRFFDVMPK